MSGKVKKATGMCRRAGTKLYCPYSLRHTFASMQSDSGVETTCLMRLMGHTTTRTVERYVSNTWSHHREAVGAVGERVMGIVNGAANGAACSGVVTAVNADSGGEFRKKVHTKLHTELPEAKRTCDVAVASPSLPST
jgi:uncharacterized membrane protein